jgi:predicted RNase H-like HicB family nuclease
MSATASPRADSTEPAQLTISYTENEDGWFTAQIVEVPEAISQGASRHDAWVNVLEALYDLTHEPTLAERVAFAVQARIIEPLSGLRDRLLAAVTRRPHAA